MTNNMKAFLETISKDRELIKKVSTITDKAEIIAMAKENGFELTEADFEAPEGELSESELSGVTGGGSCFCAAGGGGTAGGNDSVCACVVYGQGNIVDNPTDESLKEKAGTVRCVCIVSGVGQIAEEDY